MDSDLPLEFWLSTCVNESEFLELRLKTVLFLCTGNYYRSRFAEYLFNHLAKQHALEWRADSRGLAPTPRNIGAISFLAVDGLERLGVTGFEDRLPEKLADADLLSADHVIAVHKEEHLPMMRQMFPEWTERTEFWGVADIEFRKAVDALAELEQDVRRLVRELIDQAG